MTNKLFLEFYYLFLNEGYTHVDAERMAHEQLELSKK